jgi:hypothetical protein
MATPTNGEHTMIHFETMHEKEQDGFSIRLSITPDSHPIDWDFETEQDRLDLLEKIDNGTLVYFIARVEAIKCGIVLGTDYLGGCCYESVQAFVDDNDYYADMVNSAIQAANDNIEALSSKEVEKYLA